MGKQMKEQVVRRSITLRPEDEELVKGFAEQHGLDFSSALRFIINDWAQRQKQSEESHYAQN